MKQKLTLVIGFLVLVGAAFFLVKHFQNKEEAISKTQQANEYMDRLDRASSPRKGNPEAKVTIVEFLDPECEACRAFHPKLKTLMDDFPERVQIVVRYAPFHPNAKFAVQVLEAARKQDKYWQTLDVIFKYQPVWGDHHNPNPDALWNYLPEAGLDIGKLKSDMKDPEIEARLNQDIADLQFFGVKKTPSFFVNGRPLMVFGYDNLYGLVNEEVMKNY